MASWEYQVRSTVMGPKILNSSGGYRWLDVEGYLNRVDEESWVATLPRAGRHVGQVGRKRDGGYSEAFHRWIERDRAARSRGRVIGPPSPTAPLANRRGNGQDRGRRAERRADEKCGMTRLAAT
jgi:hypothetical protein